MKLTLYIDGKETDSWPVDVIYEEHMSTLQRDTARKEAIERVLQAAKRDYMPVIGNAYFEFHVRLPSKVAPEFVTQIPKEKLQLEKSLSPV